MSKYIENIALVGASGQMGQYILANLDSNKQKITIISREESNATFPSSMTVKKTDYSHESLVSVLRGNDILIITLALTAGDQEPKLIAAAAEAGIKYVMPNMWGINILDNHDLRRDLYDIGHRVEMNKLINDAGMIWMGLCCGFWYEYSLSGGPNMFGFDFKNKTVRFFDDGETKMNTSTWDISGEAVGKVLQLPIKASGSEEGGPSLSDFENRTIRCSSFLVSQKDMFESVKRVTKTQDKDWKVQHITPERMYKEASKSMEEKGFNVPDWAALLYARCFYNDNTGYYEKTLGLDNGILGLKKEDLDTCTKKAIERAEKGDQGY